MFDGDELVLLQRLVDAVEQVRRRLLKAADALERAGVQYAIIGGNAVAAWVATVDRAAVRNTQNVDILIRRADFQSASAALEGAGFVYRRAAGLDLFLDSAESSPREAVHLVFAGEVVKPGEPAPNPDVEEFTSMGALRVIDLRALAQIKLTAYRDKDRVHLRDLIGVGLITGEWVQRFPPVLAERLQRILDTPDG